MNVKLLTVDWFSKKKPSTTKVTKKSNHGDKDWMLLKSMKKKRGKK